MVDVVGDICGVHAQVQTAAELALAVRVDGLQRQDVPTALWQTRELVRMTSTRGTIHLQRQADAPVWLAATLAGGNPTMDERRLAYLGLEPAQMDAMVNGIAEVLDGRRLTLKELAALLAQHLGDWVLEGEASAFGGSWPHYRAAVYRAGWAGLICFGPPHGREVTYVRCDQWLDRWEPVEPDAALTQTLRWYLRAFGPATRQDFARWLAVKPAAARRAFELLAPELEEVELEQERRYELASAAADPAPDPPAVRLLPHFDQYLLGSHPRRLLFEQWIARGLAVAGGGNVPVLLIDGVAGGLWRRDARGRRVAVTVESFEPLGPAQLRDLRSEVERLERFTGVETALELGEVRARPHL